MDSENNNFKKWNELKEGDTIYYFDHGKLHEQVVHSVEEKTDRREYSYGFTRTISETKYLVIKAGRSSEIKIYEYEYKMSWHHAYYFTRYTCKEAALWNLKERYKYNNEKAERLRKKYEKYAKLTEKYSNIINDIEKTLSDH